MIQGYWYNRIRNTMSKGYTDSRIQGYKDTKKDNNTRVQGYKDTMIQE